MWRAGSLAERSDVLSMVSLERQHSVGGLEAREPLLEPRGVRTIQASRRSGQRPPVHLLNAVTEHRPIGLQQEIRVDVDDIVG